MAKAQVKLEVEDVLEMIRMDNTGCTNVVIASKFGISEGYVSHIIRSYHGNESVLLKIGIENREGK